MLVASAPVAITLFGLLTTVRTEMREKRMFLLEKERDLAVLREQSSKKEQMKWLQSFADFIRHESRDAFAAAISSLRLLSDRISVEVETKHINRADKIIV